MVILPLACFGAINVKSELLLKIMVILVGVSFSVFVPVVNISIMTAAGMTSKVFAAANGCWTLLGNALSLAMPFVFNALQKNMGMQNATSMMCLAGVLTVVGALIYPSNKKIKAQAEASSTWSAWRINSGWEVIVETTSSLPTAGRRYPGRSG